MFQVLLKKTTMKYQRRLGAIVDQGESPQGQIEKFFLSIFDPGVTPYSTIAPKA